MFTFNLSIAVFQQLRQNNITLLKVTILRFIRDDFQFNDLWSFYPLNIVSALLATNNVLIIYHDSQLLTIYTREYFSASLNGVAIKFTTRNLILTILKHWLHWTYWCDVYKTLNLYTQDCCLRKISLSQSPSTITTQITKSRLTWQTNSYKKVPSHINLKSEVYTSQQNEKVKTYKTVNADVEMKFKRKFFKELKDDDSEIND